MCTLFELRTFRIQNNIKRLARLGQRAEYYIYLKSLKIKLGRLFRGKERKGERTILVKVHRSALDLCFHDLAVRSPLPPHWSQAMRPRCGSVWGNTLFKQVRARNFLISGKKVDLDLRAFDKLKGGDAECKAQCFSKILPYAFALYSIYSMLCDDNPQRDIVGKRAPLLSSGKFQLQTYTLYHEDI